MASLRRQPLAALLLLLMLTGCHRPLHVHLAVDGGGWSFIFESHAEARANAR